MKVKVTFLDDSERVITGDDLTVIVGDSAITVTEIAEGKDLFGAPLALVRFWDFEHVAGQSTKDALLESGANQYRKTEYPQYGPVNALTPWSSFKGLICKGSTLLGSACGTCEKCVWERTGVVAGGKHVV